MSGIPPKTEHLGLFKIPLGAEDWHSWMTANFDLTDAACGAIFGMHTRLMTQVARLEERVRALEASAQNSEPDQPED